jgi:DeoR/GlpR family transcriptional regulator of sugar metabolism
MDTHHMTIKEATLHYGVSDKTIRRRIKTGLLSAQQINGR